MKIFLTFLLLILLPGCALTGIPKASDPVLQQILTDLSNCERNYTGGVGATPSFTFSIKCLPVNPPASVKPPAPVPATP